jgi:hypothetical protein
MSQRGGRKLDLDVARPAADQRRPQRQNAGKHQKWARDESPERGRTREEGLLIQEDYEGLTDNEVLDVSSEEEPAAQLKRARSAKGAYARPLTVLLKAQCKGKEELWPALKLAVSESSALHELQDAARSSTHF